MGSEMCIRDRHNSYRIRPCEVARTNDGNSVLVLATFSEPQRLCLVVPASSSLSQCDGQWRAARRALPGRFAAQWPCEGCGRLALPILLTCRSAPRGPVAESSGGAEIERARFGRRGWTCAAARVRLVHRSLSPILAATLMPPRGLPTLVVLPPVASSSVAPLSSASFCNLT